MSDMKCPICGEMLQKYGEVDPDTGMSIVLGANCPKCGIRDSDIKLWQELIRTRKAFDVAKEGLKEIRDKGEYVNPIELAESYLDEITALEQKE